MKIYQRLTDRIKTALYGKYLKKISELEDTCQIGKLNLFKQIGCYKALKSSYLSLKEKTHKSELKAKISEEKANQIKEDCTIMESLCTEQTTGLEKKLRIQEDEIIMLKSTNPQSEIQRYFMGLPKNVLESLKNTYLPKISQAQPKKKIKRSKIQHHTPQGLDKFTRTLSKIEYVREIRDLNRIKPRTGTNSVKQGENIEEIFISYVNRSNLGAKLKIITTARTPEQAEFILELIKKTIS